MSAIILTSGTGRQADTLRRTASAPYVSPQRGVTTDDGSLQETIVKPALQQYPTHDYRKWATEGAGVETALFVSVQAVMLVCIVLVAVQLFAAA